MKPIKSTSVLEIYKLYFIHFLFQMNFFGAITIPYFIDWAKLNYTQAFTLEAVFMAAFFLFEIPTGIIADRFSRKLSLFLTGIVGGLGWLMFGLFTQFWMLVMAEIVLACGFSLFSGADRAFLYDTLIDIKQSQNGKKYLAYHSAVGSMGMVIGLIAGPLMMLLPGAVYPSSLRIPFLMTVLAFIGISLVSITLREPTKQMELATHSFLKLGFDSFKRIFKDSQLRQFAFNISAISAITFFIFWFYQPILKNSHIPIGYFGLVGATFNIISAILLFYLATLEKWFGVRRIVWYSAFIPGVLFIGLAWIHNSVFAIAIIIAIASIKLIREPILQDYMNQLIPSAQRATTLSAVSMLEKLMRFGLYPLMGFLADISLSYALVVTGMLTIAFLILMTIKNKAKSSSR